LYLHFVFVGVLGAWTQTRCTVTVNCCGWPICWSSTQSLVTLKPQLLATIQAVCRDARSPLSLQWSSTVVRPFTHINTLHKHVLLKSKWSTGCKLCQYLQHLPPFATSTLFYSMGHTACLWTC